METLQNPDSKSIYDKSKYVVKYWEHKFKQKNGRQPSKLDIREAPRDVRNAYRTYFNLKSAALEESFMDLDAFNFEEDVSSTSISELDNTTNSPTVVESSSSLTTDTNADVCKDETWGAHLSVNSTPKPEDKPESKSNVNNSLSKKLFSGSKFSKRNPRKSLSFSHRKSDTSLNSTNFLSQPSNSPVAEANISQIAVEVQTDLQEPNKVRIVSTVPEVHTAPVNFIQSVMDSSYRPLRMLDSGWVQRVTASSGNEQQNANIDMQNFLVSQKTVASPSVNFPALKSSTLEAQVTTKVDYDSDDIIGGSDEEEVSHIAKKLKTDVGTNEGFKEKRLDFSNILSDAKRDENAEELTKDVPATKNVKKATKKTQASAKKVVENKTPLRKSARKSKARVEIQPESDQEQQDPYHTDGSKDSDFELNSDEESKTGAKNSGAPADDAKGKKLKKKIRKKASPKTPKTPRAKTVAATEEDPEEPETYELEYSVKPRIKTVPRISDITNSLKATKSRKTKEKAAPSDGVKTKRQQEVEKFEQKLESGNLNENFVRINMKKKVFVRGKKSVNFSKYKKQQWKGKKKAAALAGADMDMGGCDGGMLTCFNCGQVGHFARHCQALKKGDSLMPAAADEEVCPFPTLEEVSEMVKDSPLGVRKPQRRLVHESGEEEEICESANEEEHEELDEDELLLVETLKMEQLVAKIDMQQYMDAKAYVKPCYELKNDGRLIDTPREVLETLEMFGHSSFRTGQELAIMRILSGKSTLVTLSTGSGKSLCYQLPAYLYSQREPCITLIISPLVSLMEDQVTGIPQFLKAACLHTNQTKVQREKIMDAIRSGNINVLLVSPEAVVAGEKSNGFGSLLRKLPPIAFACIDEVHCVSQWSHNFRPSYLMICRILRERLGVSTILGLTATATRATSDSIIQHLQIPDGREGIITDTPLPDNLRLTVSKDANKDHALLNLLLSERFAELKSVIVYCTRREECERVAAFLRTSLKSEKSVDTKNKKRKRVDVQAEPYHAGMSASRRRTVQKAFMSGELRIVVATVAFGMGINKSDIRAVIHYNMPSNFESYVQEVGRSGRDGLPAHCHLFLDSRGRDENELKRHIHANSMDRHVVRKLLQRVFIPCSCKTNCPRHEVAFSVPETVQTLDITEETISTLLCYLELHANRYIEVLSPAYTTCRAISYGGPMQIRKAAKECPPLAMALALHKNTNDKDQNVLEFPIIDVASAIGWDSGICKHKLKNLEWTTVNNQPKRSTISVQFSNLGFRMLAPGNLSDAQLDEALDALHGRVMDQEKTALLQLYALHTTVLSVVEPTYRTCIKEEHSEKEKQLKCKIREYFNSPKPLEQLPELKVKPVNEEQILADTRALIYMYRDNTFTGRAVARIFHGIQSPNYPAVIWGRCKFWRGHLGEDFHTICRIATREIIKMR